MKIKTSLFYSLAAATLMSGVANAQNSATDPVGFMTLTVKAPESAPGSRFSLLSYGLVNPIEYASAATAIDATTITVADTPFAGIDYGSVDAVEGGIGVAEDGYIPYYVEITSGAEAGAWANITDNGDNTLTVDRDLSAAGNDAKIAIRKHVTINDLFGSNNEAGLDGDDQGLVENADEVSLFAGGSSRVFFYVEAAGLEGWYSTALRRNGNTAIEPQQAVYVERKSLNDVNFTRAGHVKVGPTKLNVNESFNAMANPRAVGYDDESNPVFTLGNSGLYTGDPTTGVDASEDGNASKADDITILEDNGDFSVYFYIAAAPTFDGWADASFAPSDDVVLDNGRGFLINRRSAAGNPDVTGTPFVWTVPAEVIAP